MKIIKKISCQLVTTTSINVRKTGNYPHTTEEKTDEQITVEVIMDTPNQKYELADFLKEKGFKQSDGMFGKQKDFGTWSQGEKHWVALQFQNKARFQRLYNAMVEWTVLQKNNLI